MKTAEGGEKAEEVSMKVEEAGGKAEAMDIDAGGEGGPGTGEPKAGGGAEEWRWRIMSLTILPGETCEPPCMGPCGWLLSRQRHGQASIINEPVCHPACFPLPQAERSDSLDGPITIPNRIGLVGRGGVTGCQEIMKC